jgi:hypothetical protein
MLKQKRSCSRCQQDRSGSDPESELRAKQNISLQHRQEGNDQITRGKLHRGHSSQQPEEQKHLDHINERGPGEQGEHTTAVPDDGQVAFGELAVEEVEDEAVEAVGEFGVVADAFVAHEGVGAVDLVPAEARAELVEAGEHLHAAFEGDVRVLAAPDHEEFAVDVGGALEGVVVHAFAEAALVDVGGVEAGGAEDVGVHGGAEGEVAADADAHRAEVAGAVGARGEVVEDGAGVGVVAGELLGGLELVAAVGAGLVVGEDGAGGSNSW